MGSERLLHAWGPSKSRVREAGGEGRGVSSMGQLLLRVRDGGC